jgi:hypothetical protein
MIRTNLVPHCTGQTSHITQLTRHNAQLTRQLQEHHNTELVREENRALQNKVAELTAEVQRMASAEAELRASASSNVASRESEVRAREREERESELARLRMQNAALLDEVGELKVGKGKSKGAGTKNVLGREGDDEEGDEDTDAQMAELEADAERLRGMVAALQVKVRVGSEERKVLRGILVSFFTSFSPVLGTVSHRRMRNWLDARYIGTCNRLAGRNYTRLIHSLVLFFPLFLSFSKHGIVVIAPPPIVPLAAELTFLDLSPSPQHTQTQTAHSPRVSSSSKRCWSKKTRKAAVVSAPIFFTRWS